MLFFFFFFLVSLRFYLTFEIVRIVHKIVYMVWYLGFKKKKKNGMILSQSNDFVPNFSIK